MAEQRARVAALKELLGAADTSWSREAGDLLSLADDLVRKTVWIVGGDGWAYDIGAGGLDHVLACGRNVNILVLDTEVYSNTGGQASKATPRGGDRQVRRRAARPPPRRTSAWKPWRTANVYVAQVALGASDMQTVRAFIEAEAWPGASLIIAYSTCIAHGIDMAKSMTHQKDAVRSGYWPLYRYDPGGARTIRSTSTARSRRSVWPSSPCRRRGSRCWPAARRRIRTGSWPRRRTT